MRASVRVKICGVTNASDALLAGELGADALGFILRAQPARDHSRRRPRHIERLPPFITPVAVVVNETLEAVREIMERSGCRLAQLHGEEAPEFLELLERPAIKALPVAARRGSGGAGALSGGAGDPAWIRKWPALTGAPAAHVRLAACRTSPAIRQADLLRRAHPGEYRRRRAPSQPSRWISSGIDGRRGRKIMRGIAGAFRCTQWAVSRFYSCSK